MHCIKLFISCLPNTSRPRGLAGYLQLRVRMNFGPVESPTKTIRLIRLGGQSSCGPGSLPYVSQASKQKAIDAMSNTHFDSELLLRNLWEVATGERGVTGIWASQRCSLRAQGWHLQRAGSVEANHMGDARTLPKDCRPVKLWSSIWWHRMPPCQRAWKWMPMELSSGLKEAVIHGFPYLDLYFLHCHLMANRIEQWLEQCCSSLCWSHLHFGRLSLLRRGPHCEWQHLGSPGPAFSRLPPNEDVGFQPERWGVSHQSDRGAHQWRGGIQCRSPQVGWVSLSGIVFATATHAQKSLTWLMAGWRPVVETLVSPPIAWHMAIAWWRAGRWHTCEWWRYFGNTSVECWPMRKTHFQQSSWDDHHGRWMWAARWCFRL